MTNTRLLMFVGLLAAAPLTTARAECLGQEFAGQLDFTTRVTGAKSNSAIGVNGYYRMRVDVQPNCAITVSLVKLGFNKIMFSADKLQWGNFSARAYAVPGAPGHEGATALFVDASLQSAAGRTLDMAVTLVSNLDTTGFGGGGGFWRHLGASWESGGMWGGLVWESSSPNGPYSVTNKPACQSQTLTAGTTTVAAFFCEGLFVANNDLSRAVLALPPEGDTPAAYYKLAEAGPTQNGGFYFDVCGRPETESSRGKPTWVDRFGFIPGQPAVALQPSASSAKRCGARLEPAPPAAPPRWNGGVH
jgi:hypothetical protein